MSPVADQGPFKRDGLRVLGASGSSNGTTHPDQVHKTVKWSGDAGSKAQGGNRRVSGRGAGLGGVCAITGRTANSRKSTGPGPWRGCAWRGGAGRGGSSGILVYYTVRGPRTRCYPLPTHAHVLNSTQCTTM